VLDGGMIGGIYGEWRLLGVLLLSIEMHGFYCWLRRNVVGRSFSFADREEGYSEESIMKKAS
jgi:hypothetical protein